MKIDEEAVVLDLDGNPINDGGTGKPVTIAQLAKVACSTHGLNAAGNGVADFHEQAKRLGIAEKIRDGKELEADDAETIKVCVAGKFGNPTFTAAVMKHLNNQVLFDKAAKEQEAFSEHRKGTKKPAKGEKEPD